MVFTNCITEMDFDRDDACDTGLALGLGCREKMERQEGQFQSFFVTPTMDGQSRSNHQSYNPLLSFEGLSPVIEETSLSLRLFEGNCRPLKKAEVEELAEEAQQSSPLSVVSSFSNTNHDSLQGCFKRERDQESDRGELGTMHEEAGRRRKKLRLTKEQSVFLEESFKEHNTLNPKHKQALAKKLNLRPRQVEVWFQNRRARTKLKQTEVDCDFMKRWCEKLAEENRRLKKELQQLKDLKFSSPFCIQLPAAVAATLTVCPSCSNIGGALDEENAAKRYAFFTNPSAAC